MDNLETILLKHSIKLSEDKLIKLDQFKKLVLEKNKVLNLTSITDEYEFDIKHLLDSLIILNYLDFSTKKIQTVADLGTGAGIPGIPLAIAFPEISFTLIDSTSKKIAFIDEVVEQLELRNVHTLASRVEEIKDKTFDLVLNRGFNKLSINLELLTNLIKINGEVWLYKTIKEIPTSNNNKVILQNLGLKFENSINYKIDNNYDRVFIFYKKIQVQKSKYVRTYSLIKKNPIF